MSTEITAAANPGSLAAVGTAAKAFVLVHPVSLSIAAGVLLGAGGYWGLQRLLAKRATEPQQETAEPAAA